jgi:predicted 2-oxoglutarate/Fe(II)-dependent dioxygenase YbiX
MQPGPRPGRDRRAGEFRPYRPTAGAGGNAGGLSRPPVPLSSAGNSHREDPITKAAPTLFEPPSRPQYAWGDHTPLFACRDSEGRTFEFYSAVTGKPVVLLFAGGRSLAELSNGGIDPAALAAGGAQVVTLVPGDTAAAAAQKEAAAWPHRVMADPGGEITNGFAGLSGVTSPAAYVLDPNQRLVGVRGLGAGAADFAPWLTEMLTLAAHGRDQAVIQRAAPALLVPRALDPEDCAWLIGLWHNGERDDGTVAVGSSAGGGVQVVPTTKRREDYYMRDKGLEQKLLNRLMPRLVPEVSKAFHFEGYTVETFKIGCYKAEKAGFFTVHRDDTSPATKHRKFAVTLNLNTGDYEGGDLRFPEYGPELYRPEKGAAVVFSCSLLHEVLPVTKGHRFVLLTFLNVPVG